MSVAALPAAPATPEGAIGDAAIARIVTRITGSYILRAFQLVVEVFGDMRAALLVQAISAANVVGVYRTAEARSAAGPDGSLPDELRRPIRIARLADSTGLPFETARRIVLRLVNKGVCRIVEGGVILPRSVVTRPEIVRNALANVGYVRKLIRDLQAVGLVEHTAIDPVLAAATDNLQAAREVMALSAEYMLRAFQLLIETYGDIRAGIVAQTIVTTNTAHLDDRNGEGWRYVAIDQPPPDEVRRPISVARLAESLGLPYETTRAQVRRLIDSGVCVRIEGGVIAPMAALESAAGDRSMLAHVGYVRKFVRDVQSVDWTLRSAEATGDPSEQSVWRFFSLLEAEESPSIRTTLRRLLVSEEDRLGARLERLDAIDRLIAEREDRISTTALTLRRLYEAGSDAENLRFAETRLANMRETLTITKDYRRMLVGRLEQSRL